MKYVAQYCKRSNNNSLDNLVVVVDTDIASYDIVDLRTLYSSVASGLFNYSNVRIVKHKLVPVGSPIYVLPTDWIKDCLLGLRNTSSLNKISFIVDPLLVKRVVLNSNIVIVSNHPFVCIEYAGNDINIYSDVMLYLIDRLRLPLCNTVDLSGLNLSLAVYLPDFYSISFGKTPKLIFGKTHFSCIRRLSYGDVFVSVDGSVDLSGYGLSGVKEISYLLSEEITQYNNVNLCKSGLENVNKVRVLAHNTYINRIKLPKWNFEELSLTKGSSLFKHCNIGVLDFSGSYISYDNYSPNKLRGYIFSNCTVDMITGDKDGRFRILYESI